MPKRLTQNEFIAKAKIVHGDKYDYSNVIYTGCCNKIIIICKKHNKFVQDASSHLQGIGCPKCKNEKTSKRFRLTIEEFIKRSKNMHGNIYDYSLVEYMGNKIPVKIICKKHGFFYQLSRVHFKGGGCPKCSFEKSSNEKRSTKEEFIKKAQKIHGEKYDYSKIEYKHSFIKIIIICKKHGEFKQQPCSHLQGYGCKKCAIDKSHLTTEEFISKSKKIHGNLYDYSKTKYKGHRYKVIIICKKHGIFYQRSGSHLKGSGCKKCSWEKQRKNTLDFIKDSQLIHKNKYCYDKVKYITAYKRVSIICPIHGIFKTAPHSHLVMKSGCPYCFKKSEFIVKELLNKYFKDWKINKNKLLWKSYNKINKKRYCDFFLKKDNIKIMIEYDGQQHFYPVRFNGISLYLAKKSFKRQKKIDKLDKKFCEENNIILHRIKYNEDKEKSIIKLKKKINTIFKR